MLVIRVFSPVPRGSGNQMEMNMSDHEHGDAVAQVIPIEAAKQRRQAPPPPDDDARDNPPEAPREAAVSDVEMLVALLMRHASVFVDEVNTPYAHVQVGDHREVMRLASRTFRVWFETLIFATLRTLPPVGRRREALTVVEGIARMRADRRSVHLRVAGHGDRIYVDLTNDGWEAVEVSPTGWSISNSSPVMFRRSSNALPLPTPVAGGNIEELRTLVNVRDDDSFHLLVGYLVMALRPRGPYPIAALAGEQGSAKSTTAKVLRLLLDPSRAPLRALPKYERDLAVSAVHNWVLAYDNLSGLAPAMSDALCRIATGGGLSSRQLFTDSDEVVLDFSRPMVINGIDDLATRPDLAERALLISLPRIEKADREDEATFWKRFEAAAPRILGALLDGVSAALANVDSVVIDELPRMADFATWVTAAEPAFGWAPGTILGAYRRNRVEADADALDRDPVASLIPRLLRQMAGAPWEGTPTSLYQRLSGMADEAHKRAEGWPRAANSMTGKLRRIAPLLRAAGISLAERRIPNARLITICWTEASRSSSSSSDDKPKGQQYQGPDGPDGSDGGAR
ncbi:MAG: hypothetical protein ACHREM_22275 [Polyangiales bacterium]